MSDNKSNNKVEINFLKVLKTDGQYVIQLLKEHFKNDSVIDNKYKTSYQGKFILFPLVKNKVVIAKLETELENSISHKFVSQEAIKKANYRFKSLQEALTLRFANSLSR